MARGVQLWVDGGWGIDALLDRQTSSHKNFDAIVAFEDLPALTRFLSGTGFQKYKNPAELRFRALLTEGTPEVKLALT